MLNNYLTLGNGQFEIRFVEGEERYAQESFAVLARVLPLATGYFGVSEPFPKVRAVLAARRDEFDRLVRDFLGVPIEVPSHPARIAQAQRTDMVLLSPSAYESYSDFKYIPDQFGRLIHHELIHMMEETLSPDIEASPRWWSEGLAVYLSGQGCFEDEFRSAALEGITGNKIPGLGEIGSDRRLAYDWGWTIVWFLESAYGRNMIVRIVKECGDGDVFSTLGENVTSLEVRWREFILTQGSPARNSP